MLSCFNLKDGVSAGEFQAVLDELTVQLRHLELLNSTSPLGRRQRHPVMDTDEERDHEFFFIMSFKDRAQCDRAVAHMYCHNGEADTAHRALQDKISNPVFICWEDVQGDGELQGFKSPVTRQLEYSR